MFKSIAQFAMQGRWQAAAVISLLAILSLISVPLIGFLNVGANIIGVLVGMISVAVAGISGYLSVGVIALTTLRMGPSEGAKVVTATLVIFTLLAGLLLGNPLLVGLLLVSNWIPVYLATLALGYTRSLLNAVLAATGVGLLIVLTLHMFVGEPAMWWQEHLTSLFQTLSEQGRGQLNDEQTKLFITNLSFWMTGIIAAGVTLNALLGVLIGRSWQSKLYSQGAFNSEFRQLRMGKLPALLTVLMMAISLTPVSKSLTLLVDCLPVFLLIFTLQGLSILHAIVYEKQKSKVWIVSVYVLLVIMMPKMIMILATLGVLDQWFNLRDRSKKSGTGI